MIFLACGLFDRSRRRHDYRHQLCHRGLLRSTMKKPLECAYARINVCRSRRRRSDYSHRIELRMCSSSASPLGTTRRHVTSRYTASPHPVTQSRNRSYNTQNLQTSEILARIRRDGTETSYMGQQISRKERSRNQYVTINTSSDEQANAVSSDAARPCVSVRAPFGGNQCPGKRTPLRRANTVVFFANRKLIWVVDD